MGMLLMALGGILSLVAFVCSIIILIGAFQDAIWKGIVGLLCGLYLLYFAFAEWQHPNKMPIILGSLVGGIAGSILMNIGMAMSAGGVPVAG